MQRQRTGAILLKLEKFFRKIAALAANAMLATDRVLRRKRNDRPEPRSYTGPHKHAGSPAQCDEHSDGRPQGARLRRSSGVAPCGSEGGLQDRSRACHQLYITGAGGWKAAVTGVLSPGDKVLVSRFGTFSRRWIDLCQRHNLDVKLIECDCSTVPN